MKLVTFESLEIADKFRFPHDDPDVVRSKISNRRYRTGSKVKTVRSIDARCYKKPDPTTKDGAKTHGTAAADNSAARDTPAPVRAMSVGSVQGNQLMSERAPKKSMTFEQKYKVIEFLKENKAKLNGKRLQQLVIEIDRALGIQISKFTTRELCTLAKVDWDQTRGAPGGTNSLDRVRLLIAYEAIQSLYTQLGSVPALAFTKTLEALQAGTKRVDEVDDDDDDE
jgi:hypothetical protein